MTIDNTLLDRFLDGEANEQEQAKIALWLQDDDNLVKYVTRAELHANLRRSLKRQEIQSEALASCTDVIVSRLADESDAATIDRDGNASKKNGDKLSSLGRGRRPALFAILALASAAILAYSIFRPAPDRREPTNAGEDVLQIATIAYQSNAAWADKGLRQGHSLKQGVIQLDVGIARLDFTSGAKVTLQGPAEFEIESADRTRLHHGTLTAQIPSTAIGFQVLTPALDVVDLGTAFGVAVAANGETDVCVFEGEVEVRPVGETQKPNRLLREGNAVRSTSTAHGIESVTYETSRFEDGWPVTSGVLQATGLMKFVAPGPGFVPGRYEDDEHISVFPERTDVVLQEAVAVDLTRPGLYQRIHPVEQFRIEAGQRVRSYLLQLDPLSQREGEPFYRSRVVGQITFDRPIIGLILRSTKLNDSDAELGHPLGEYGKTRRGIEPPSDDPQPKLGRDEVTLSPNRRTLSVDLSAAMAIDQIRIIVRETK
ncbi:MAG: hypothetical protein ACR2NZ_19815 [Rubripirellula sp.]